MNDTITDRVARGATWLDIVYPGWWKSIDLGLLNVASCHQCVLGQVYSGHIPAEEANDILAQVVEALPTYRRSTFLSNWGQGVEAGYQVLIEHHELLDMVGRLGFAGSGMASRDITGELIALTDEWTRLVISRRLHTPARVRELATVS